MDDDGAALWAGCDNDARGVRAIRSGKWRALVGCGVGGKNIPCAKAHRGCGGYGVDVGHGLESLRVVLECRVLRVLLLKCCGEMCECGWGQSALVSNLILVLIGKQGPIVLRATDADG